MTVSPTVHTVEQNKLNIFKMDNIEKNQMFNVGKKHCADVECSDTHHDEQKVCEV